MPSAASARWQLSPKAWSPFMQLDHVLAYLGASLIEDFHEAYPSIILSVVDTTDAHAIAALASQQCSFAITAGPLDETRFEGDPHFFQPLQCTDAQVASAGEAPGFDL